MNYLTVYLALDALNTLCMCVCVYVAHCKEIKNYNKNEHIL